MRTAIMHRVSRKYVDEEEIVSDISQKYLASTFFYPSQRQRYKRCKSLYRYKK